MKNVKLNQLLKSIVANRKDVTIHRQKNRGLLSDLIVWVDPTTVVNMVTKFFTNASGKIDLHINIDIDIITIHIHNDNKLIKSVTLLRNDTSL